MSPEAMDRFLARPLIARLAMSDNDRPRVLPMWFWWDGTEIWMETSPTFANARILRRNRNAALAVERRLVHACTGAARQDSSYITVGDAELLKALHAEDVIGDLQNGSIVLLPEKPMGVSMATLEVTDAQGRVVITTDLPAREVATGLAAVAPRPLSRPARLGAPALALRRMAGTSCPFHTMSPRPTWPRLARSRAPTPIRSSTRRSLPRWPARDSES